MNIILLVEETFILLFGILIRMKLHNKNNIKIFCMFLYLYLQNGNKIETKRVVYSVFQNLPHCVIITKGTCKI